MSFLDTIPDTVYVSFYMNAVTIVLVTGVLVLYYRGTRHDLMEKRLFSLMAVTVALLSVSYVFETAANELIIPLPAQFFLFEAGYHDVLINLFCLNWLFYATYRIHGGFDYIMRKKWLIFSPFVVLFVLNVLNMFFPVLLYIGSDQRIHDSDFYIVQDIIRYAYMIGSAVFLYIHKKQGNFIRFFNFTPFVMPAVVGALVHDLTPFCFQTMPFGMAVGLSMLYAQLANEQSFCDKETGFFNRNYIGYIFALIRSKKYNPGSVLVFDINDGGNMEDFSKILKDQLPQNCEPIRLKKNEIIVFSSVTKKAPLHMVAEDVRAAVDEYNGSNNAAPIEVSIKYQLIKKSELGKDFMGRVLMQLG